MPTSVLESALGHRQPLTDATHRRFPAAVLFADISGFTRLSERLASKGERGVEDLTRILNSYFGRLIEIIHTHGGDVVKFAGDALLAVWRAEDEAALAGRVQAATQCALAARDALRGFALEEGGTLSLRLGIGGGEAEAATIGGIFGRWEYVVYGPAMNEASRAAAKTEPDQVTAGVRAWAFLRGRFTGAESADGTRVDVANEPYTATALAVPEPVDDIAKLLLAYIPAAIHQRLAAGQSAWLGEMRCITVLFVNLPDVRSDTPVETMQRAMRSLQDGLYRFEGSVNKLSIDEKGVTLVELAFALRDAGVIIVADGECQVAPGKDLSTQQFPDTVQGVVISRIDRLTPLVQLTLKVASVIGRTFSCRVLSAVFPTAGDSQTTARALETLVKSNLTVPDAPEPDPTQIFRHMITQEVAYNLMPPTQRSALHRAAAEWYERAHRDNLSTYYPLLARHGTGADDLPKAIDYLENSAEEALRHFANEEAIRFLAVVSGVLKMHGMARLHVRRARETAELVNRPACTAYVDFIRSIYWAAVGAWDEAETDATNACRIAAEIGERRRWMESNFSLLNTLVRKGAFERAVTLSRELVAASRRHGSVQGIVWGLSRQLWSQGMLSAEPPDPALGLELAKCLESETGLLVADRILGHAMLAWSFWRRGDLAEATKAAGRARELSARTFLVAQFLETPLPALGEVCYEQAISLPVGDPARAESVAALAHLSGRLARFRQMYPSCATTHALHRGRLLLLQGKPAAARRAWHRGLRASAKISRPYDEGLLYRELARHLPPGDPAAVTHADEARRLFESVGARGVLGSEGES